MSDEGEYMLTRIRSKCADDAGCWVWKGYAQDGTPMMWVQGRRGPTTARREAWIAAKGPLEPGMEVWRACESRLCVNPEHLQAGDRFARAAFHAARSGKIHNRHRKPTNTKLTPEMVAQIRAATEGRNQDIGARFGVSRETVRKVRMGIWYADPSNPFSALLRRAA